MLVKKHDALAIRFVEWENKNTAFFFTESQEKYNCSEMHGTRVIPTTL